MNEQMIEDIAKASAIEAAAAGETTEIGSTKGESAVGAAETPAPRPVHQQEDKV